MTVWTGKMRFQDWCFEICWISMVLKQLSKSMSQIHHFFSTNPFDHEDLRSSHMGGSINGGTTQSSGLMGFSIIYKPSIWGYPQWWKPPYVSRSFNPSDAPKPWVFQSPRVPVPPLFHRQKGPRTGRGSPFVLGKHWKLKWKKVMVDMNGYDKTGKNGMTIWLKFARFWQFLVLRLHSANLLACFSVIARNET